MDVCSKCYSSTVSSLYTRDRSISTDSVFINQINNAEKTKQIGLMRYIYRNATGVIACLYDIEEP